MPEIENSTEQTNNRFEATDATPPPLVDMSQRADVQPSGGARRDDDKLMRDLNLPPANELLAGFGDDKAKAGAGSDHSNGNKADKSGLSAAEPANDAESGQRTVENKDSQYIERDSRGRITETKDILATRGADRNLKIDYGKDGTPNKLTFADNSTLSRDGDKWQLADKNGDPTDKLMGMKLDPSKISDVALNQKTGELKITNNDDSTLTHNPDGSAIQRDGEGKPTEMRSARDILTGDSRQTKINYDENGREETIAIGDRTGQFVFSREGDKWLGGKIGKDGQVDPIGNVKNVSVDRDTGTVHANLGSKGLKLNAQDGDGKDIGGEVKSISFMRDGKTNYQLEGGGKVSLSASGDIREANRAKEKTTASKAERDASSAVHAVNEFEKNPRAKTFDGKELPFKTLTVAQTSELKNAFENAGQTGPDAVKDLEKSINRKLASSGSPYEVHQTSGRPERGSFVAAAELSGNRWVVISRRR